jgi:hypothetical protein
MLPGKRQYVRLLQLFILIVLVNFVPLIGIGFGIGMLGLIAYDWVTKGYIPNSQLEAARDAALHKHLDEPGKYESWRDWAIKTTRYVEPDGSLPGDGNHALFPYLMDRHDANEMDRLLTERCWPRLSYCSCERVEGRPWEFDHVVTCPVHPNYVDPDQVCTCVKKRRKGKVKTYRSITCPVHGGDVAEVDEEGDEILIDQISDAIIASQQVPEHIYGHPLGPPILSLGNPDRIDFPCGCYAFHRPDGEGITFVNVGMCGRDHKTDLDNLPTGADGP